MTFSKKKLYQVYCPKEKEPEILSYVNKVEEFIPTLDKVFALEPSYKQLQVYFGNEGPYYEFGGKIKLQTSMDFQDPGNIYGGLFHETIHGYLEKYIYRDNGVNEFPEPCAIILQIAALNEINKDWADKFSSGYGLSEDAHPLLFELVRIYKEYGFNPIQYVYKTIKKSSNQILRKENFIEDLNNILKECGVKVLIKI